MLKVTRHSPLVSFALLGFLTACSEDTPPPAAPPARELPGRTHAFVIAEVRPQVTGIVQERLFTEGALVEAGEVLYQLDDALYQAEFNSARARLARAKASLELAQVSAERTAGLFESNAVSRQENDNAQAALRQAEADAAVAEAAVVNSSVLLGYSRITSPISGRIGKSSVTQGALVTANQPTPLATVQQLDPIYVDLTQSSSELLQLRRALASGNLQEAELPVTILLEDGTPYAHEGRVAFSDVTVDPGTGRFCSLACTCVRSSAVGSGKKGFSCLNKRWRGDRAERLL